MSEKFCTAKYFHPIIHENVNLRSYFCPSRHLENTKKVYTVCIFVRISHIYKTSTKFFFLATLIKINFCFFIGENLLIKGAFAHP